MFCFTYCCGSEQVVISNILGHTFSYGDFGMTEVIAERQPGNVCLLLLLLPLQVGTKPGGKYMNNV